MVQNRQTFEPGGWAEMTLPGAATRFAFGVATALVLVALILHASTWLRRGGMDVAAAGNMLGLFVLMATGTFDPPHGRFRFALTAVGLALIVPSSLFLFARL